MHQKTYCNQADAIHAHHKMANQYKSYEFIPLNL